MLQGEFKHSVDSKNRMFVPAKFREELGETFVVAKSMSGGFLKMLSKSEWDNYIEPIKRLSLIEQEKKMRIINRTATQVTPDAQGRIVISQALMEYAAIIKNAVIVGCGSYAEIWSEERNEEILNEEEMTDMATVLSGGNPQ